MHICLLCKCSSSDYEDVADGNIGCQWIVVLGLSDICKYINRLREIVRRLETGQVDKTTLVDNLQYAAAVLEHVHKVETRYGALSFWPSAFAS